MLPRVGRRAGNSILEWLTSRKSFNPPRVLFELLKPQVANTVSCAFYLEKCVSSCLTTERAVQGLNAFGPVRAKVTSSQTSILIRQHLWF